ncbi:transporter [Sphingomonas sp. PAMC 26617]|uniref:transporter n=1 Tax=Sphingomonas sp. PAMC 26617 TaxID=1112216 RepID=UPI00028984C8|nr:transporter [Sphingomonas sp. PAMC 26617]
MKYAAPKRIALLAATMLVASAAPALAQEAAKGDPAQGTGPLPPNVAPDPTPICTDRPSKATTTCTVPAGAVQIETDLVNWTRETSDGVRTDTVLFTNPTLKYGVGRHTDVEVNFVPYESVRMRMDDGSVTTDRGIGDLYLRAKQKLTVDKSKTQVALVGFVKAPTAGSTRGNGHWEGGAVVPVNIPLPFDFTLTTSPELDISADQSMGNGNHVELANLINLAHPVGKKATVYAELWTKESFEPRMNTQQYSADFAAAYQITKTLQLDASAYIGLNRETPGLQLYTGISTRF